MHELRTATRARRTMVAAVVALTAASIAYRALVTTKLQHTSLVFIGIPAILALLFLMVQPKTSAGTIHKTIAIALCLSGIVFGEGFVCILMASPLFFLVGALMARLVTPPPPLDATDDDAGDTRKWKHLGIALLVPMSLEGVVPHLELPRDEVVTVSRTVFSNHVLVQRALAQPMQFDRELPRFFTLGFPTPGATSGAGLAVGSRRSIAFEHGGHHPGTLVLEVTESAPNHVRFTAVADDSYLTHWLAWRDAEVRWREVAPSATRVTWTLRYRRRLDPAWYFAPLERYGVRLAASYLIETLATPRRARIDVETAIHPAGH
jgi:hypothetical protein